MKLNFTLIIICTLFISCITNWKQENTSNQVIILGTVHFPTEKINADSIYQILKKVKPDFILMEADSSVFNSDFSFKKTFDENEYNAVIQYLKEDPTVQIRPIEFEGRNEYRNKVGLFPEASNVFQKLNQLNNDQLFSSSEQKIWNNFEKYWQLSDSIGKQNLKSLNNQNTDSIIDSLMNYQYTQLKRIVNTNNEFEKLGMIDVKNDTVTLKSYFEKWTQFEGKTRNEKIAENIKNFVQNNPNKRIIVLIGFKHRFYVKTYLNTFNIKTTEFYE